MCIMRPFEYTWLYNNNLNTHVAKLLKVIYYYLIQFYETYMNLLLLYIIRLSCIAYKIKQDINYMINALTMLRGNWTIHYIYTKLNNNNKYAIDTHYLPSQRRPLEQKCVLLWILIENSLFLFILKLLYILE